MSVNFGQTRAVQRLARIPGRGESRAAAVPVTSIYSSDDNVVLLVWLKVDFDMAGEQDGRFFVAQVEHKVSTQGGPERVLPFFTGPPTAMRLGPLRCRVWDSECKGNGRRSEAD